MRLTHLFTCRVWAAALLIAASGLHTLAAEPAASPWTRPLAGTGADTFRFAIMADATGGERLGVFDRAIEKLNVLQPEFVLCVGDLIQGYEPDAAKLDPQYTALDARLAKLQMPFHHVPGNHDITNEMALKLYRQRYGGDYSHFVYGNVLFLCLNTQDAAPGNVGPGIGEAQLAYIQKALADNAGVRWTLVFMHQPLWHGYQLSSWEKVEAMLKERPYTVFAGHEHAYLKETRNGRDYFCLSTTGGGSALRGALPGEFDHLVWVTMGAKGPTLANLMLDGIQDDAIRTPAVATQAKKMLANVALRYPPLYVTTTPFQGAALPLLLSNDTDTAAHLTVAFQAHPALSAAPATIAADLAAHTTKSVDLTLTATSPRPADSADGLVAEYRVVYTLPDGRTLDSGAVQQCLTPTQMLDCPRRENPIAVDGKLDDWKALPCRLEKPLELLDRNPQDPWRGPQDGSSRFGVRYDDQFLYIGVETTDECVVAAPGVAAWSQDGLEIRLDARPDPVRAMGRGEGENATILLIPVSPGDTPAATISLEQKRLPPGTQVVCLKTATGYNTEIAIPVAYLNERQGGSWKEFRLNLLQDDLDRPAGGLSSLCWRPDWRRQFNYAGSGTFVRK